MKLMSGSFVVFLSGVRDADVDRVEVADRGKIGSSLDAAAVHQRSKHRVRNVPDVGFSVLQKIHFRLADIDSRDRKTGASELDRERQPDIAEADNTNPGGAVRNLLV